MRWIFGLKQEKCVYLNNNIYFTFFRFILSTLYGDGLSLKTISRYCPFKASDLSIRCPPLPAFGTAALEAIDEIATGSAIEARLQLTLVYVDLTVLSPAFTNTKLKVLSA